MHIAEIVGLRGLTVIPMFVLGYSKPALSIYIFLVYLNATFVHANVRFNVEWLKPLIVTRAFTIGTTASKKKPSMLIMQFISPGWINYLAPIICPQSLAQRLRHRRASGTNWIYQPIFVPI